MPVLFAESTPSDLKEAILDFAASEKHVDREDLSWEREDDKEQIGWIDRTNDRNSRPGHQPQNIIAAIRTWAQRNQFAAVVWTNYPPNFEEIAKLPFSPKDCETFLRTLEEREMPGAAITYKRLPKR
jgi:hypothetical protein